MSPALSGRSLKQRPLADSFEPFYRLKWASRCRGTTERRVERGAACWIFGYSGLLRCETRHASFYLAAGDAVMLAPSAAERVVCKGAGTLWWLEFDGALATGHLNFLRRAFSPFHERVAPAAHAVLRKAEALIRGARRPPCDERELLERSRDVFEWLVAWQMFLESHRPRIRELYTLASNDPRLEQFAPFTLKELGRWLGESPNTLRRRLQRIWGAAPANVLRDVRLRAAARALQTSTLPVVAVAARWGFRSPDSFAQALHRHLGILPRECRSAPGSFGNTRVRMAKGSRRIVESVQRSDANAPKQARSADWEGPYFQVFLCADSVRQEPREQELWHGIVRHISFVCTIEGYGDFAAREKRYRVTPGTLLLHPLPVAARWINPPQHPPWRRIFVMFRGALAMNYFDYLVARFGWRHVLSKPNSVTKHLVAIRRKIVAGSFRPAIEWSQLGYRFFHAVHGALLAQKSNVVDRPPWDATHGAPAPEPPRSVAELAREAGYTRTAYYRKMKSIWARPPGYVLRARRIELAAKELRTTVVAVQAIARQAGYRSAAAFGAAFKKIYGVSPLEYRRRHRA